MTAIVQFVLRHGYSTLFAALFARQIGFPLPGPLFLLAAGALAADGKLGLTTAIGITIMACVLADWIWYEAGRRGGDRVLHLIYRFTRDPAFHYRRAKRIFAHYGLPLLLVAKFVLGVDALAPPLAGIMRTSRVRFLAFDAVGAALYACVYGELGYFFGHDLDRAALYVVRAGRLLAGIVVLLAFCIYAAQRLVRRYRRVQMPCGIVGAQENGD